MDNNVIEKALNERFLLQEEYLGVEKPINQVIPMVSVTVTTYQHVNYIKECLDGILMQQVDFPYEIIIGEDGSVDGTQEVCKEYAEKHPNKIRLFIRNRNLSQYIGEDGKVTRFNGIWNRMSARGKYIAWCEGDDYWTDPLKLQKQVDFLESHLEYGMCYAQVKYYVQVESKYGRVFGGKYTSFEDLFHKNTIPTLTVMLRTDLYKKYNDDVQPNLRGWKMGDYPMWLWFAHESSVAFIPEIMGVYRILETSASHSVDEKKSLAFNLSNVDIKQFYNEFFKLGVSADEFIYKRWCMTLRSYSIYSNWKGFRETWLKGVRMSPKYLLRLSSYKYLLFIFFPHLRKERK